MQNLGNILGIIGFLVLIIGLYQKKDSKLFLFFSLHSFFMGLHFLLLGLISGSFVNLLDVIKNVFGYFQKSSKFIIYSFVLLYSLIGFYTYDGSILGILPIVASFISLYAVFYASGEKLRFLYGIIFSFWFFYSFFGGSLPGIFVTLLLVAESFYGYFKIHKQKKIYKQKINSILSNK